MLSQPRAEYFELAPPLRSTQRGEQTLWVSREKQHQADL
jgi:hypothetical protein